MEYKKKKMLFSDFYGKILKFSNSYMKVDCFGYGLFNTGKSTAKP